MEKLPKPAWVKMKEPELKKIILELSEKNSPSQIGFILRDQYGIPTTKIFGKKLKAYLEELGINRNEDLENAEKKVNALKEHTKKNITDRKAKHKLQQAQSRLNITKKYFNIPIRTRKKVTP
jgi:small subunit ribosomal protein S15